MSYRVFCVLSKCVLLTRAMSVVLSCVAATKLPLSLASPSTAFRARSLLLEVVGRFRYFCPATASHFFRALCHNASSAHSLTPLQRVSSFCFFRSSFAILAAYITLAPDREPCVCLRSFGFFFSCFRCFQKKNSFCSFFVGQKIKGDTTRQTRQKTRRKLARRPMCAVDII